MPPQETSAEILQRYREGEERAAEELFYRYMKRLTLLARSRLSLKLASQTDPEDIVQSTYRSFFIGAREGRFTLARSGDLWRLLVSITLHKLYRHVRKHKSEISSIPATRSVQASGGEHLLLSREPSPDEAIAVADELGALMSTLDAFSRRVLQLRLQGRSLSLIAADTGRSERTIRRTLGAIRKRFTERREREVNG